MARADNLSFSPPHRRGDSSPRVAAGESPEEMPPIRAKGRGAGLNMSGRFEPFVREFFEDGWSSSPDFKNGRSDPFGGYHPKTEVTIEKPRKVITYNNSPFVGFDRSINPYRGCEHGCIYCFARPTHAYIGLSPGLDFETKLFAKPNAPVLLERELSSKNYRPRPIAIGTNTDPYQPAERQYQIMRSLLSIFDRFNHPVTILTKGSLVTRDIDVLSRLAERNLTRVMLSITTEDKTLARHLEPRASAPSKRFEAIEHLAKAGISVGVMTAPIIPGLNDSEMESILGTAKQAGAKFAGYTIIRLPLEVSPLFQDWLNTHAPSRARRIMRHIREMNNGKDYDVEWSRGREAKSTYAKLIAQRFKRATGKLKLSGKKTPLDISQFRIPQTQSEQMSLF